MAAKWNCFRTVRSWTVFLWSTRPAGEVEGRLIRAGLGRPEDIPDGGFEGGIALIRRGGGIRFRDKALAAAEAGAGAVLIYNDRPGPLRGSLGELVPVPVLGLDGRTGQHLVEQASRGPGVGTGDGRGGDCPAGYNQCDRRASRSGCADAVDRGTLRLRQEKSGRQRQRHRDGGAPGACPRALDLCAPRGPDHLLCSLWCRGRRLAWEPVLRRTAGRAAATVIRGDAQLRHDRGRGRAGCGR